MSRDGQPKLARGHGEAGASSPAQLRLFAPQEDPVLEAIRRARIDAMTPIEALNFLADLKRRLPG